MKRDEVIRILGDHRQALKAKAVKSLAIFGSVARDEAAGNCDVDLLVEFENNHPTGLFEFISLKNYLEDVLGSPVDLVMRSSLRPEFREQVFKEAILAA